MICARLAPGEQQERCRQRADDVGGKDHDKRPFPRAEHGTDAERKEHVVFLLWGTYAQKKAWMIDDSRHLILQAPHPSPFSADRGFFGCKHFSQTNAYLKEKGIETVQW